MSGKNNKYTEEFKQTIVNLYRSGKTYTDIQKEYGTEKEESKTRGYCAHLRKSGAKKQGKIRIKSL